MLNLYYFLYFLFAFLLILLLAYLLFRINFQLFQIFELMLKLFFLRIPGTPGMLSELSPCKPFTSINCFGSIPYVSIIFCLLYSSVSVFPPLVWGILIVTLSVASWNVSLSPDKIVTSNPCFSP